MRKHHSERAGDELNDTAWNEVQRVVQLFRQAIASGERPEIREYAAMATAAPRLVILEELVHEELEFRVRKGEPANLAGYLEQLPELRGDNRIVRELFEAFAASSDEGVVERASDDSSPSSNGPVKETRSPVVINGRYELFTEIGRGSFGVVHRARDLQLKRDVAIKRPVTSFVSRPDAVARILHEARYAARLEHPNIVTIHDCGEIDGEAFLVSQFIDGRNLARHAKETRPSFRQVVQWVANLASAVEYAHQQGIIHRDIKPGNILIDGNGQIFLADFGLAKQVADDLSLTGSGLAVGTLAYMAPERLGEDHSRDNAKSDIYSLGVVLYELLTGERPFEGPPHLVSIKIREDEPPPPRALDDKIPVDLETVCLKAMAKQPADRYETAGDLRDDLERFLVGEPVNARPISWLRSRLRQYWRRPAVPLLVASIIVLVATSFVSVTWLWLRAERYRARDAISLEEANDRYDQLVDALDRQWQLISAVHGNNQAAMTGDDRFLSLAASAQVLGAINPIRSSASTRDKLAGLLVHVAGVRQAWGDGEEAAALWSESYNMYRTDFAEGTIPSDDRESTICLAHTLRNLRSEGRHSEAELVAKYLTKSLESGLAWRSAQVKDRPKDLKSRIAVVEFEEIVVGAWSASGQAKEAINTVRRIISDCSELLTIQASNSDVRGLAARAYFKLGQFEKSEGRLREALTALSRSERLLAELGREQILNLDSRVDHGKAMLILGSTVWDLDRPHEALGWFRKAVDVFESVSRVNDRNLEVQICFGTSLHNIGRVLAELNRLDDAINVLNSAAGKRIGLFNTSRRAIHANDCGGTMKQLAVAHEKRGQLQSAVYRLRDSVVFHEKAVQLAPSERRFQNDLATRLKDLDRLQQTLAANGAETILDPASGG